MFPYKSEAPNNQRLTPKFSRVARRHSLAARGKALQQRRLGVQEISRSDFQASTGDAEKV
jgi:hypothetical protein